MNLRGLVNPGSGTTATKVIMNGKADACQFNSKDFYFKKIYFVKRCQLLNK